MKKEKIKFAILIVIVLSFSPFHTYIEDISGTI